jgi:NO-binding membrane sensor protein with MHYT domain
MVALSFLISVVGSFIALHATPRILRSNGRVHLLNTFNASVALGGIGVWAMHFVGVLALRLPIGHGYSMVETGISLAVAVLAAAAALVYVARDPSSIPRLVIAGFFLGLGVCFMHYLGMYGMRFGGFFAWSESVVALSGVIAVVAATAALWLAFNVRGMVGTTLAALVMGGAVCAMHYTGMSAAEFICTTANRTAVPTGFGVISSWNLPSIVLFAVGYMILQLGFDQIYQSLRAAAPRRPSEAA